MSCDTELIRCLFTREKRLIKFGMFQSTRVFRNLLICCGLTVVIGAVYWPVGRSEFTNYDDDVYVIDNPHVQGGVTFRGLSWALTPVPRPTGIH